MKVLIVNKSWFDNSELRLDASYHLSDGPTTKLQLKKSPHHISTLSLETKSIFKGNIFKRIYIPNKAKGYPFMTASEMMKSEVNCNKYVSTKYTNPSNLLLKKDWILVSRSGTIGKTAYTNENFENLLGTDDLIRIIPNNQRILSGYMYAYLSSRYGYGLITQSGYGGVVQHIEPHHLEEIPIPILPLEKQQEIHNLIIEANSLRFNANKLLNDAQKNFKELLKLDDDYYDSLVSQSEATIQNKFKINISDISSLTFRGRNYSPRKQEIFEIFKSSNYSNLRDVLKTDPFYGARYKRVESTKDNSVELLSQGDIFDLMPKGRKLSLRSIKDIDKEIVSKGTILVPAQGTLGENEIFGRAKFVWGYLENTLVAGHAMRFIPNESKIDPGYLFCVLSSPLWFRIFRNSVFGTNLLGFIIQLLNNSPIPRFDLSIEKELGAKVKDAYEKLTQGIKNEKLAIKLIEKEIESWQ